MSTIGTDAYNAIASIPGVTDVQIDAETEEIAEISYTYTLEEKFWGIGTHLDRFYLERAD